MAQKFFNALTIIITMILTIHIIVFVRFLDGNYHDSYFGKEFGNNVFYHPRQDSVKYYWISIKHGDTTSQQYLQEVHPFEAFRVFRSWNKTLLNYKELTKEEYDLGVKVNVDSFIKLTP